MIRYKHLSADELFDYENYHLGDLVSRLHYFSSIEASKETHLVAIDDGAPGAPIVGIAGLQESPYEDDMLWFKHVSVDPQYRGQGVGTQLTELAINIARYKGMILKFSDFERESVRDMVDHLAAWHQDVQMVTTDEQPISSRLTQP